MNKDRRKTRKKQTVEPDLGTFTKALSSQIDADVKRMLREDAVVGRWVRQSYPEQFERMLKRARSEMKFKKQREENEAFIRKVNSHN